MTEENQGAEPAAEQEVTPPTEAVFSSQEPEVQDDAPARDFEAEASDMGWVPEDRFKGDPERWVDAETFVKRGEEFIPFLQADRKRLRAELDAKDKKFETELAKIRKATEVGLKAAKAQHEAELARIRKERIKAAQDGDEKRLGELDAEHDKLAREAPAEDEKPQSDEERAKATVDKWAEAESWYTSNRRMRAFAIGESQEIARENPDISLEDNLAQVAKAVREEFPEHFKENSQVTEKPKRAANGHAAVDSGGFPAARQSKKAKTFDNMPAEYRQAWETSFKDSGLTKEAYAQSYYAESANG